MSNIFITDIIGSGTYAVPGADASLAAATAGLETLLSGVANLTYDRVLAWVEDQEGPDGAEGVRTLNCLIEKFTYLTKECPSEAEVDALGAAIEAALEADASITSVSQQQFHIFQAGAYFLWNRDAAGGFLYPNTTTDDVAVGGHVSPAGKWFNDGDMVLGDDSMSGTERLLVTPDTSEASPVSIYVNNSVDGSIVVTDLLGIGVFTSFTTDGGSDMDVCSYDATFIKSVGPQPMGDYYGYKSEFNLLGLGDARFVRHFYVRTPQLGITGPVSEATGLRIEDMNSAGGSLQAAFGVYIEDQTASFGSFGVYQQGADDNNVFNGYVAIGVTSMSGSEQLRVSGDVLIDDNSKLTIDDSGTIPPLNITERSSAPANPAANDIYLDDGSNTASGDPGWRRFTGIAWEDISAGGGGGTSLWQDGGGYIYPNPSTDDVTIGGTAMSGSEKLYVSNPGTINTSFRVLYSESDPPPNNTITTIENIVVAADWDISTDVTNYYSVRVNGHTSIGGPIVTNAYGFYCDQLSYSGAVTNAYGVYIEAQESTSYGVYQAGTSDTNAFLGTVGVGTSGVAADTQLEVQPDTVTSAFTGILVDVNKNSSDITGARGIYVDAVNQSSSSDAGQTYVGVDADYLQTGALAQTDTMMGFRSTMDVTAGTIDNVMHFVVNGAGAGGGTITDAYGFFCEDLDTTGVVSNAYAIYIVDQSPANLSYGIYQAGADDDNYFNGRIGIKDATPSYALDVAGDINVQTGNVYRFNGNAGLSATYTFGGGASGDIASMTFEGGILTGVTTVP